MARILVVDDEVNLRKLYKSDLEEQGFTVVTAANGLEAMQSVQAEVPDLVILDIKLAQDNGLDCLRRIKEFNATIPVILNSGYSTYKDDFSSWLADAYLVKASNTQELANKVRELLELKPVI